MDRDNTTSTRHRLLIKGALREQNHSTTEKEAFAIATVWHATFSSFDANLAVSWITDHNVLKWLMDLQEKNSHLR